MFPTWKTACDQLRKAVNGTFKLNAKTSEGTKRDERARINESIVIHDDNHKQNK